MLLCLLLWVVVTMLSDEQDLPLKDCSDIERENRELREALTREAAELARVTAYTASAIGASRLAIGAEMVKLGYVGLREQLAAAQAVISAVRAIGARSGTDLNAWNKAFDVINGSPTDALQAHDRQVAAKALTDAADDIYSMGGTAGFLFPAVRDLLRARAAAIVSEPSTPEVTGAFRKMDALAAKGEDTPEYRTAFAEFERAARDTSTSTPEQEGQNR